MKIYAIEITSQCNLRCSYCPQPTMARKKEHMPLALFERLLDYPFANDLVIGHLFGEALLHPDLLEMTRLCRERGLAFGFSTNGVALSEARLGELLDAGLAWLVVSFHNRKGRSWYDHIKEAYPELPLYPSELAVLHDWGGQIDPAARRNRNKRICGGNVGEAEAFDCIFHVHDWVSVTAQGEVVACCFDAEARSAIGPLLDHRVEAFSAMRNDLYFDLCSACPKKVSPAEVAQEAAFLREGAAEALRRMKLRAQRGPSSPTGDRGPEFGGSSLPQELG